MHHPTDRIIQPQLWSTGWNEKYRVKDKVSVRDVFRARLSFPLSVQFGYTYFRAYTHLRFKHACPGLIPQHSGLSV